MPCLAEPVLGQVVELARIEQRLARDAADVEAGAAERRPLLDAGHLHAELRGADRGDVAAGAGADHDQVVTLGHRLAPWNAAIDPQMTHDATQMKLEPWQSGLVVSICAICDDSTPRQTSSISRSGFSMHSLIRTRKLTASRPSMIRWS